MKMVGCSSKSQCSIMPASSTTLRSCTSPQRPRTPGERKRADQVLRLQLQLLLRLTDQAQHGPHAGTVVDAAFLDLFQFRVDLGQRVADGCDQRAQFLLPPREIDGGFLVDVANFLVGELDELVSARS